MQLIVNPTTRTCGPTSTTTPSRWVPRLWRRDIRAGHWSPISHPQVLAAAVAELADHLEGKPASRALLRAQVGRPRERLRRHAGVGDRCGQRHRPRDRAGLRPRGRRGGRQRHRRGRRQGDRRADRRARRRRAPVRARRVRRRGRRAVRRRGVRRATVCPTSWSTTPASGRPGHSSTPRPSSSTGCSTSTSAAWSTAAGRSPSGMVERGTGGHIVNVASMAAYAPLQSLNAYCTSKAAVYMFSDCLRAELDAAGIGLTTICPGVINTNIVSTTRFRRRRRASAPRCRAGAAQLERMFELRALRSRQGGQRDRVRGQEEQADPARHPRGLPPVRHLAGGAAGVAQHGPREDRLVAASRWRAMSSSTANIVRVGTPVPPLRV